MITKNTPSIISMKLGWSILCYHLLNLFLTLGIRSFVQGDCIGGGAVLETQVLGGILVLAGYGVGDNNPTVGSTLVGIGNLAITASYITSFIILFTFANRYNVNLRKRLGILLAGFEPNFDIGINGFQLSFKKSY
ncbi:P13 family porin (plasmid) [Borreliella spielmanii]|uniref:Outer membrane protein P13 n=1 Tax=Borreliella spielmanii A14S TaxID=498742 RepID=C0RBM8_9SPIR|nr:P13 family porin [Borreliella spielmanii]ACN53173.1 outer membrane protein P13 [Borreliella spielmanii A14S]